MSWSPCQSMIWVYKSFSKSAKRGAVCVPRAHIIRYRVSLQHQNRSSCFFVCTLQTIGILWKVNKQTVRQKQNSWAEQRKTLRLYLDLLVKQQTQTRDHSTKCVNDWQGNFSSVYKERNVRAHFYSYITPCGAELLTLPWPLGPAWLPCGG